MHGQTQVATKGCPDAPPAVTGRRPRLRGKADLTQAPRARRPFVDDSHGGLVPLAVGPQKERGQAETPGAAQYALLWAKTRGDPVPQASLSRDATQETPGSQGNLRERAPEAVSSTRHRARPQETMDISNMSSPPQGSGGGYRHVRSPSDSLPLSGFERPVHLGDTAGGSPFQETTPDTAQTRGRIYHQSLLRSQLPL